MNTTTKIEFAHEGRSYAARIEHHLCQEPAMFDLVVLRSMTSGVETWVRVAHVEPELRAAVWAAYDRVDPYADVSCTEVTVEIDGCDYRACVAQPTTMEWDSPAPRGRLVRMAYGDPEIAMVERKTSEGWEQVEPSDELSDAIFDEYGRTVEEAMDDVG